MLSELKYVVVEGPIGVGKTTLAKRLAETLGCDLLLEQVEENPFLQRFYSDRRHMALPTQLFFLLQRARQTGVLRQADMFMPVRVADFLPAKEQLFARATLDEDEYTLYRQVSAHLNLEAPAPDLVICLQASVETLHARVMARGRAFEAAIQYDYLRRIRDAYIDFFHHYDASPLLVVNTDQFNLASGEREYGLLLERMSRKISLREYFNPA